MTCGRLVVAASLLAAVGCGATNEMHAGGSGGTQGGGVGGTQGGGAGGTEGGGSPKPFIQILSALADGTTHAGQGPFPVTFYGAGRMLDATTLADLVARLGLTAWPEGTVVPVTTVVDSATTAPTTPAMMATAHVSPTEALAGRWYALGFGPPADGLTTTQTFDSDVWGLRLRPDSQPAVRLVEFCWADATSGMKLITAFSEPVTVDSPADALVVQQNGAAVSCRLDAVGADNVHEFCATLTPAPAIVSLSAGSVHGANGAPLAADAWPVDIAQLPFTESGCHGYRVPLRQ